jgi:hypothetical protein
MEEPNGPGAEYVASVVQCPDMIKQAGQPAARNERKRRITTVASVAFS